MSICSPNAFAAVLALAKMMTLEKREPIHLAVLAFTTEDGKMTNAEVMTTFGENSAGLLACTHAMEYLAKQGDGEPPPEESRIILN
jgi:hypothetical protein